MRQPWQGQEEAMLLMWHVPGSVEAITPHGASPPGEGACFSSKAAFSIRDTCYGT